MVAAVVRRGDRYLLCRRPAHKRHGGLWEFPGGKVSQGETYAIAIQRELSEELGVQSRLVSEVLESMEDGGSGFVIHFLSVAIEGEPMALEHEELGWFSATELCRLRLAPADARFARSLPGAGLC